MKYYLCKEYSSNKCFKNASNWNKFLKEKYVVWFFLYEMPETGK